MKTLLLMRHGKSDWKDAQDDDKQRPLTKKGEKEAHKMGELIIEKGYLPQIILTSTAVRARTTALTFLKHCCEELTLKTLEALYLAEPLAIVEILKTVPDEANKVMVIGHNPGLEGLLQQLSGKVESLPTASAVGLELPIEHWADLSIETRAEKCHKWKPKDA